MGAQELSRAAFYDLWSCIDSTMADDDVVAMVRLVFEAHPQRAEAGPKAILNILQPLDERFSSMNVQKFKRIFGKAKELSAPPLSVPVDFTTTFAAVMQQLKPMSQ